MLRASGAYPKEFSDYIALRHKAVLEGDPLMHPGPALDPSQLALSPIPELVPAILITSPACNERTPSPLRTCTTTSPRISRSGLILELVDTSH